MSPARPSRVIVIGAGAAGLATAARLCRSVDVVVVEARGRLGGRIDTRPDPVLGIPVEHGAEFLHGRPPRTVALARRAGARVRIVPDRHARRVGGRMESATGPFSGAQELLALGTRDDEPFAAVLRAARRQHAASSAALAMAGELVRGFYLAEPGTASSLSLARLTRALEQVGGDVTGRIEGGYARVLEPLRRALARARAEVRLSSRVEEVRWRRGHVDVRMVGPAGGSLAPLHGERVVVTLPVPLLRDGGVRFRPPLPEKGRAAAALEMGPVVKVILRFRRPLWIESGPRALAFLHVPGAPIPVFWTLAPLAAPVLVGWAGGPDAAALAGREERSVLGAALRSAARGLGRSAAQLEEALDGAAVVDWTRDPFARGGYAVFPVGSAAASGELARSVDGTLFFAGEATAGGLAGTVEGALRSGERAAREVLRSLALGSAP